MKLATHRPCGIWADGSAWCWDRPPPHCTAGHPCYPKRLPLGDVEDAYGTCVVSKTGKVMAVPPGSNALCQAAAFGRYPLRYVARGRCILTTKDEVWCWPDAERLPPRTATPELLAGEELILSQVSQLADAGTTAYCAVRLDGSVWCWGPDTYHVLPSGKAALRPTRIPGLSRVKKVVTAGGHACALKNSGAVYCWGINVSGELGIGKQSYSGPEDPEEEAKNPGIRLRPQRVRKLPPVADLVATRETCALTTAGEVYCWGTLGDPAGDFPSPTLRHGLPPIRQLVFWYSPCALAVDGSTWCWGARGSVPPPGRKLAQVKWTGYPKL